MSITTHTRDRAKFSTANHVGHTLGVLISAGNVLVGSSPGAREGDGYNGNIWIAFVVFGGIGGVALVLVGVASLGVLFVPDIGTAGRIANSVGALLQFSAAALVLLPARSRT